MTTYTAEQLTRVKAVESAFFGKSARAFLHEEQNAVMEVEVQREERNMPREVYANISGRESKEFRGDKSRTVGRYLRFASKFVFDAGRAGEAVDILPIVRETYNQLLAMAPRASGSYKGQFFFTVNGEDIGQVLFIPPKFRDQNVYIGVANRMDYASTLEKKNWPRTMRKVEARIRRKYRDKADTRFKFLKGGNPSSVSRSGKAGYYSLPLIEIARFGSMAGRTGLQMKRKTWHNKRERRNDWKRSR